MGRARLTPKSGASLGGFDPPPPPDGRKSVKLAAPAAAAAAAALSSGCRQEGRAEEKGELSVLPLPPEVLSVVLLCLDGETLSACCCVAKVCCFTSGHCCCCYKTARFSSS